MTKNYVATITWTEKERQGLHLLFLRSILLSRKIEEAGD